MSTKHIRTTADLVRFKADLKIECGDCGAAKTLSGVEAAKALGAGLLGLAQRRLVCSRGAGRSARLMVLQPR